MDSIKLREQRAGLIKNARNFYEEHNENGVMNAEDAATFDRMCADADALKPQIERLERIENMNREMNEPTSEPLVSRPENADQANSPRSTAEYRSAFWNNVRNRSIPYEVRNALTIGQDAEGGYLCPDEYEKTLLDALADQNIFRTLATLIQSDSGERKIPVIASHGTAQWTAEGAAYVESDDAFDIITLGAHKLTTLMKVSEELLNDSVFNLESYIAAEFARRMGRAEETAFVGGTGTGQPMGLLHATKGAQLGVTSASGTAITADEIIDLVYSLRAPYRARASFLMNDTTIKAIRKLKGTDGQYIWQPSIQQGTPDTLLGKPLHTSVDMPELAAGKKVVTFGDYSYYWISDRKGRSIKRLDELYAVNGQVGFLASQRVDGKLLLPEAVKVLATKST